MLECEGCHRYIHATESSCPFCAAPVALTSAAGITRVPMVALAAGLSLLGCDKTGDEAGDTNTVTTDPSTSTSETSTTGDGDGDTQETLDYSGSDYGGPPPPCDELDTAIPIVVGSNPVDTSMTGDSFSTSCGGQVGDGPDQLLQFVAPAGGPFTFALTGANFDAWLLNFDSYYCYAYGGNACTANQSLDISLIEGETLFLILDGASSGGTASVDVTQG